MTIFRSPCLRCAWAEAYFSDGLGRFVPSRQTARIRPNIIGKDSGFSAVPFGKGRLKTRADIPMMSAPFSDGLS
ncbi:MAG: hypothetical protein Q4D82_05650 [Neisseria sp.]|nr:hypothetical protein [Neisseria sp.]